MKRILACLATLAIASAGFSGGAQAEQQASVNVDPIGELIGKVVGSPATDMLLKATLYHAGAKGIRGMDSLGCSVTPMRTLAVDPTIIPRRTIVFIKETVGMAMPDGTKHDGLWYATDIGGAIKGNRIDLFTGKGSGSMQQFMERGLTRGALNAVKIGSFQGCPPK